MSWTQQDLWAAAAAAYRINRGYFNWFSTGEGGRSNRDVMISLLTDDSDQITDEDRRIGEEAFKTIQANIIVASLTNRLTSFQISVNDLMQVTEITDLKTQRHLLSTIASQIPQALNSQAAQELSKTLAGGHLGSMCQRLVARITVLKSIYSQKYNTHWVIANADGKIVRFAFKQSLQEGADLTIRGTVKALQWSDMYGVEQTQLNRVTIVAENA